MRAAHIKNGKVVNFVEVNEFTIDWVDPKNSVVGSTWDGVRFTPPDPDSDEEVDKNNAQVFPEIMALEAGQARTVREAILNFPGAVARLQALDDKIAAIRAKLKPKKE